MIFILLDIPNIMSDLTQQNKEKTISPTIIPCVDLVKELNKIHSDDRATTYHLKDNKGNTKIVAATSIDNVMMMAKAWGTMLRSKKNKVSIYNANNMQYVGFVDIVK